MTGSIYKQVVEGTHRGVPTATTLARLTPHLAAAGITRVANITGLDTIGIPTVVVARPNARSLSVSQGKGLSVSAAKVSGVMESLEQFHAERIHLPVALGSYRERCERGPVVDVERLPRFVRQWEPQVRCLWITARSWVNEEAIEVPFELVHLDMTVPLPTGSGMFPLSSNGLASGNSLPEAVAHAAWELIERDAVALFYASPPEVQGQRRVRLDTVDDASCRKLLGQYSEAGVGVMIWDVTSDIGIASFFCSIIERELDPFRLVGLARGYGTHPDRGVALCRALCEAAQSRLTRITGSRDDIQQDDFERIRSDAAIRRQQQVLDEGALAHRSFAEVPTQRFATFEEDLDWTQQRLHSAGLGDILYVDLSRAPFPISVTRVVIAGLEGAPEAPGYVPGTRARRVSDTP